MASKKRSRSKSPAPAAPSRPFDAEVSRLERLLGLMKEHGLSELELGEDGRSVRLSKSGPAAAWPMAMPMAPAAPAGGGVVAAPAAASAPKVDPAVGEPFLSPMVGTFYRAASPEAKAFVMEGDTVAADATLCIIEAMKVMNEIKADRAGRIVQILVENGEAVEYGQPLFLIKR
jgi:acetyl-CoA carboxylase biotin carboxyl carrier protein